MSTLRANIIDSASTTEFKGVIKTNRATINEDVTIPTGTNGLSTGPVSISSGNTVTVNGEWVIV